jgi:hypothetical protein
MKKTQETLRIKDSIKESVLYIAFELSNSKWKLAFSDGSKIRYKTITAGNLDQLQVEMSECSVVMKPGEMVFGSTAI